MAVGRGPVAKYAASTAALRALTVRDLGDLRTWWSFRENVFEDDSLAIAFLQLFAGVEPNWTTPSLFNPHDAGPRIAAPPAAAQIGQDDR